MGRRDQRMKASDVLRETNFLFSKTVSFDEALPGDRGRHHRGHGGWGWRPAFETWRSEVHLPEA